MSLVNFIRNLTGAPNDPKWNSVLFGGLTNEGIDWRTVLPSIVFVFAIGIVGSLFSFLQYISSTLCGAASDRYGRKPVLILSMVCPLSTLLVILEPSVACSI